MHHFNLKLSLRVALPLVLALTTSLGVVSAARDTATDIFYGRATTKTSGLPLPVVITGSRQLPDGTYQFDYFYRAEGIARGNLAGTFVLNQYGWIILRNPSDPTTLIDFAVTKQEIILDPRRPGPLVTILDTNPEAHQFWTVTAKVSGIPNNIMRYLRLIFDKKLLAKDATLTYGVFTFESQGRTFVGYATPDFAEFAIEITFDRPADYRGGRDAD